MPMTSQTTCSAGKRRRRIADRGIFGNAAPEAVGARSVTPDLAHQIDAGDRATMGAVQIVAIVDRNFSHHANEPAPAGADGEEFSNRGADFIV